MAKKKNKNNWVLPLALFLTAFCVWLLVWFLSAPDHRYLIRGIDVSAHTGKIDWEKVKNQNVSFAFVKASEGATLPDKAFKKNFEGAKKVGIPVSAYHFFNFNRDGDRQANNFLRRIKLHELDLPPVVDVEEWGNKIRRPRKAIIADLKAFVAIVERAAGRKVIIYTNEDTYKFYIKDHFPANDIWICSFDHKPEIGRPWTFWQYSHTGKLKGVHGKVDFNVFHGNTLEWQRYLIR
ncbi:MAG: glycoside hydrolase family 25 [Bacteroidales bacterium]|nr:glycoside hydrolase family 25 [Bacteroidales bacterium]